MKRVKPMFVRSLLLGLCLAVLPLLAGCAVSDRQVMAQAAQVHEGLEPAVITEPELSGYIQVVGQRLIDAAREVHLSEGRREREDSSWMFSDQMRFHFVASDTQNAFTTGGTHMYIYTGLFENSRSEAELAAVMAHEFAHVYARHVQRGMQRQQYSLLGAAAAGAAGYALGDDDHRLEYALGAAGAAAVIGQFVGMGYGRDDEREADRLGFQFYVKAGYPPEEFAGFFKSMIEKGYDTTPEIISTHPSLASRVKQIEEWVAQLPAEALQDRQPPVADASRFRELQNKAQVIVKTLPQDDTLASARLLATAIPNHMLPVQQPQQQQAQLRLEQHLQRQSQR